MERKTMKTGKRRDKAPAYIAKVPRDSLTRRLIFWLFRRYCLNEDYYRVVRRFTGPRPRWAHSTRKADATAFRYYLEPRYRPAPQRSKYA
jgi:hypothetical protein